jgi:hypothetical protein
MWKHLVDMKHAAFITDRGIPWNYRDSRGNRVFASRNDCIKIIRGNGEAIDPLRDQEVDQLDLLGCISSRRALIQDSHA